MSTITFRTDAALRRQLELRAAAEGKNLSAVVREILEEALAQGSVDQRAGHLHGSLHLSETEDDPWRRSLRESNWRP